MKGSTMFLIIFDFLMFNEKIDKKTEKVLFKYSYNRSTVHQLDL